MKKIFYVLLIALAFVFTGCANSKSLKFSVPEEMLLLREYSFDEVVLNKYTERKVTDKDDLKYLVKNLNKMKVEEVLTEVELPANYNFRLTFDNKQVYLLNNNLILIKDNKLNTSKVYKIMKGNYNFLYRVDFEKNSNYIVQSFKDLDFNNGVVLKDLETSKEVNVSAKTIDKLKQINYLPYVDQTKEEEYIYELKLGEMVIKISKTNDIMIFERIYKIENEGYTFDFLKDEIVEKEIFTLASLDYTNKVTFKKIKDNSLIDVTDKADFINKVKEIKYTKITENSEEVLEVKYTIMVGTIQIDVIEDNKFVMNNTKYETVDTSFEFLNQIDFQNTGWLPWI